MRHIVLLSLFFSVPTFATTKAQEVQKFSKALCTVRATFLEPVVSRTSIKRKGLSHNVDFVYWKLQIAERSEEAGCPNLGILSLRVRGASFRGSVQNPEITYAVGVNQPETNSIVDLKIDFIKGRDALTKTDYAEWILKEQIGE